MATTTFTHLLSSECLISYNEPLYVDLLGGGGGGVFEMSPETNNNNLNN